MIQFCFNLFQFLNHVHMVIWKNRPIEIDIPGQATVFIFHVRSSLPENPPCKHTHTSHCIVSTCSPLSKHETMVHSLRSSYAELRSKRSLSTTLRLLLRHQPRIHGILARSARDKLQLRPDRSSNIFSLPCFRSCWRSGWRSQVSWIGTSYSLSYLIDSRR